MQTSIGPYNPEKRTVSVTFEHKGVTHKRDVNACLTSKNKYDAEATKARVDEVARGVEHKIELGVITNTPAEESPAA